MWRSFSFSLLLILLLPLLSSFLRVREKERERERLHYDSYIAIFIISMDASFDKSLYVCVYICKQSLPYFCVSVCFELNCDACSMRERERAFLAICQFTLALAFGFFFHYLMLFRFLLRYHERATGVISDCLRERERKPTIDALPLCYLIIPYLLTRPCCCCCYWCALLLLVHWSHARLTFAIIPSVYFCNSKGSKWIIWRGYG